MVWKLYCLILKREGLDKRVVPRGIMSGLYAEAVTINTGVDDELRDYPGEDD